MDDLENLMRVACLKGQHVMVRVDPERDKNCFTVQIGQYPREDTDDPVGVLRRVYGQMCCGQPVSMMCGCGQNWRCSICGNGAGSMPCMCAKVVWESEVTHG